MNTRIEYQYRDAANYKVPNVAVVSGEISKADWGHMLCRSFGVECGQPDAADVAAFYTGMEPQERRDIFDGMRQSFRAMQQEIQKELAPPAKEQTRGAKRRGVSR